MFLSNAAVRRPVAMSSLIIGLSLLGLNAWRKLGLELMPKSDLPFITIVTVYPGASPEEIETDVAKTIEDAVGTIDGLKHISSACMEDVCQTFMEFELGVDVDIAATDVREKLDLVRSDFPEDVEDPIIQKYDINAKPIVTLALTGDVPIEDLYDYADHEFRDRVSILQGVADVSLIGGAEREVHVLLDRNKLASRGLSSGEVVEVIQKEIRLIPSGRIKSGNLEYSVKFDADYSELEGIRNLELVSHDGRRCYIRDVGRVEFSTEEVRQASFLDGERCIAIRVIKKSDANAVSVTRLIRDSVDQIRRDLPGGMELQWITDDGAFIEATNQSAWINVAQGIALTAAILFLFLYNFRSLIVVSITMPTTILIGLFLMQFSKLTLNTSTLVAIGMSVGILVTNSIVVLEAIVSQLNKTGDPRKAALLGAQESFIPVLASAGTNMVVLFPLAIMGSLIGIFFRPLALTMLIMTIVSLFLSFSLTPMLCSLLLRPRSERKHGALWKMETGWNRGLDWVIGRFRTVLQFNERHRWAAGLVMLAVLGMLIHSFYVGGKQGFGFFSDTDKGEVYVKLEYPTRYNLATSMEEVSRAEKVLSDLPELRHILSTIGKVEGMVGQSSEGVNLAQMILRFSERTERDLSMNELLTMIRDRVDQLPGALASVSVASVVGGQGTPIEIEISGEDLDVLDQLALRGKDLMQEIAGLTDIDTTVRSGKPEIRVYPQRAVLSDLNIPAVALGMNLRGNLEGLEAGTFKRGDRNYDIVVKLAEEQGKSQVSQFQLPGASGRAISLRTVADIEEGISPVQITRKDKKRVSKLFANLGPGLSLGPAIQKIQQIFSQDAEFPPGYDYQFTGQFEYMSEGQTALGEAGLVAFILVILTLSAILESYRQPLLILITIPLGFIGMMWALAIARTSLDMFALMGGVMMIGIVVNNAILIMDQFNVHVAEGTPRHRAMISAACERFRPIAMITIAAVLGMMPLAVSRGIGAELRNSVGIASVGGIFVSGILTLIVMPIIYDFFTRKARTRSKQPDRDGLE